MRHRNTVVLFILFLAGVCVLWWADYADVPTREKQQELLNRVLPELIDTPLNDVRRIEVDRRSGPTRDRLVVDRLDDGGWQLREPVDAPADPELVETLARNLKDLPKSAVAGTIKGDPSPYGLATPEAVVKVFVRARDQPVAALDVGKTMKDRVYVRPGAGSGIEVADARSLSALGLPAVRWRDTALFRVPSFRVKGVTVRESKPDLTIGIEREERHWRLVSPIKVPADDDKAEGLVAELTALRLVDGEAGFVADGVTDRSGYGLDSPAMTLTMSPFETYGKPRTVLIGNPADPARKDEVYAMRAGQKNVVRVDIKRLREAIPGVSGLRSQTVLDLSPSRVAHVRIDTRGTTYALNRAAKGWAMSSPVNGAADNAAVQSLLMRLSELKTSEFLDASRVAEPHLDPPTVRVRGWQRSPGLPAESTGSEVPKEEPRFDLLLGRHDAARKTIYGRVAGDPTVLALPDAILENLPRSPFAYRDRTILSIEPPQFASVTVERGGSAVTVKAPPTVGPTGMRWRMVEPVEAPVDEAAVTTLLVTLGDLRAESWESDRVGDGKEYGLDAPWLRIKWTLQGGGTWSAASPPAGQRRGVLRIGKAKSQGLSRYANLEGDERVFLLHPGAIAPFEVELHAPKVMGFAPAEAERVVLSWPRRTISLEKRSPVPGAPTAWDVTPGYDPAGFEPSRVDALVSSMADLKTTRFAQYSGPISNAYGLSPPRLGVKVKLAGKGGEVSLRIGNALNKMTFVATDAAGDEGAVFALPAVPWKELATAPVRPGELPDDVFAPGPELNPMPRG